MFAPPIDPGLLVKAAAAGLDIGSVLSDLNAPPPHYRFHVLAQKASESINDVKSLGAALIAALEKKDAEELALLRSTHEIQVLEAVRRPQAASDRRGESFHWQRSKLPSACLKRGAAFYEGREGKSAKEQHHLDKLEEAQRLQIASQAIEIIGPSFASFPNLTSESRAWRVPVLKADGAGPTSRRLTRRHQPDTSRWQPQKAAHEAAKALTESGYERRKEDWDFQAAQAKAEIEQVEKQITAAWRFD